MKDKDVGWPSYVQVADDLRRIALGVLVEIKYYGRGILIGVTLGRQFNDASGTAADPSNHDPTLDLQEEGFHPCPQVPTPLGFRPR